MVDDAVRLLVFRVGSERFALPLGAVDEVVDLPPVQRLPDSAPSVLGIATLRGEIVAIQDPRTLLGAGDGGYAALLLFDDDTRRIGLAIDDVYDPILMESDELRSAPGVDASDGLLRGVVRRGTDLIAVLDVDALVRTMNARENDRHSVDDDAKEES